MRFVKYLIGLLFVLFALAACEAPTPAPRPTWTPSPLPPPASLNTATPTKPPATATPAASVTPAATATATVTPTATPNPRPKVLRVGRASYPDTLDPQRAAFGNGLDVLRLVYEGLVTLDEKGNLVEAGADKWTLAADGMSLTFNIRAGMKRADGTAITARDYEFALKRAVDPRVSGKAVAYIVYDVLNAAELDTSDPLKTKTEDLDKLAASVGFKAADDKTLIVTFRKPLGYWAFVAATQVAFPADKKTLDAAPENWWSKPEAHNGNGAFKIKSIEAGKKIVLVANENYWRGKPKLDRLELIYDPDRAALLAAYKKGDLDLLAAVAPEDLAQVDADATLKNDLTRLPIALTHAFALNSARKPFDDRNVRAAFSQAFDREGWVRETLKGVGKPYTRWIPPGVIGATPDKPGAPSDAKLAVLTLVNNGYAARDSTPDKPKVDCAKLGEIKLTYNRASSAQLARMQFLAANFTKAFGCPVTPEALEPAAYNALFLDARTMPQITFRSWVNDMPHPANWLSAYWVCGAYSGYYGYCNKNLDTLIARADRELDLNTALGLYQQIEETLLKDVPAIFASYAENVNLIKPYVKGLKERASANDTDWAGASGPAWTYDIDLTQVPANYPDK